MSTASTSLLQRLSVVTPHPKALALRLAEQGIAAHTQALHEVLTLGQGGRRPIKPC